MSRAPILICVCVACTSETFVDLDPGGRDAEPSLPAGDAEAGVDVRDAGLPDRVSGREREPERMDRGFPDASQPPVGDNCTPGATPLGSCTDSREVCHTWTEPDEPQQISTCVIPCFDNLDCGSIADRPFCGNVAFEMQGAVMVPVRACVAELKGEGDVVSASGFMTGVASGCPLRFMAYGPRDGSGLSALDPRQRSCAQPCGTDSECLPDWACSLVVPTATVTPGACTLRHAGRGMYCSRRTIIESCDLAISPNLTCIDVGMNAMHYGYGVCIETCMMNAGACSSGTCEFGFFANPTIGVCDDNCSSFPDTCTAPRMSCAQFAGTFDLPDRGLCLEGSPYEPTYPDWDFMAPPMPACAEDAHRCGDGTFCVPVDLGGGNQTSACVYGCNTQTMLTGCELHAPFTTCNAVFGFSTIAGVCQQM